MRKKYKIIVILGLFIFLFLGFEVTYSLFHAEGIGVLADEAIAKFVFEAEESNLLNLDMNLAPGEEKTYEFKVANGNGIVYSDVNIEYQITIKTFHFMPVEIKLFKNDEEEAILNCDESYSRGENNELICRSPYQQLNFGDKKEDNYQLKVIFPTIYNGEEYADIVDFLEIKIDSHQIIGK